MEQTKCYVIDLRQLRKEAFRNLMKRGTLIKVAGITFVLIAGFPDVSFASGTGIDVGANRIYKKLVNVGKWVIIVRGGIDTIKSVSEGDLQAARKSFLGYLITYATLWALPWGMNEVESLFSEGS
jgi:hypothetical protein